MVLCFFVCLLVFLGVLKIVALLTAGFNKSNTCLIGKTVLITGGNRGLGYETALGLAARGCRLIIADRDDCEETKNRIIEETNNTNIVTKRFDLASFASVRKFAEDINKTEKRLDILINNAGIGHTDQKYTDDNNVVIMQINHLGGFLLTHLLMDLLKKTGNSRVIFVSSLLSFTNNLTLENLNEVQKVIMYAYGNTKLCNIITARVLGKHLKDTNARVTVNALHPGLVKTVIFNFPQEKLLHQITNKFLVGLIVKFYGKTPYEGCQTALHLALSRKVENVTGKFFSDCSEFYTLPSKAKDEDFCRAIFEKSEQLVGLKKEERIVK